MRRYVGAAMMIALFLQGCGNSGDNGGGVKAGNQGNAADAKSGGANQVKIDEAAQEKAGIKVAAVSLRSLPQYLVAAGQVVLDEELTSHVGSYTDGRVVQVFATVGDFVRKGAILARMHSHDVHETRAAYDTALADVKHQENNVDYARRMRDRMNRLFQLKSASRQEVEKAETDLRAAETGLTNAKISVIKEEAHLTDILALPASDLPNLNETTELVPIVAPAAGTVIERKITPGSVVEPGAEVFVLSELTTVWMMAAVNETDISKLHVGNCARLLTQAFPNQAFTGRVQRLGTELDPQTRTLQVRIVVPNPGLKLRPAMYANAQIDEGTSTNAIFVPEDAVQDINGSAVVFAKLENNTFEARAVQIAHRLNGEAQISAGLKPGDQVVVKGSFVVKSDILKSQIGE
jgi:membrane fusion protein, heavy metal efflux system